MSDPEVPDAHLCPCGHQPKGHARSSHQHVESRCPWCPFAASRTQGRVVWCPCGGEIPIELPIQGTAAQTLRLRCTNCLHLVLVHDAASRPSGRHGRG